MLVKRFDECVEFTAGDGCRLREFLHPDKQDIRLRYSFAHATVAPRQATKPHRLKDCSEVYYILEGNGVMHINDEYHEVSRGSLIYIPPGVTQYIRNTANSALQFICIVDPAWQPENERIL